MITFTIIKGSSLTSTFNCDQMLVVLVDNNLVQHPALVKFIMYFDRKKIINMVAPINKNNLDVSLASLELADVIT